MSFKVVRCVAAKTTQVGVLNGKFRLAAMMHSMIEVSESRMVVLNDKLARPREQQDKLACTLGLPTTGFQTVL
jgi:hypothetical protein